MSRSRLSSQFNLLATVFRAQKRHVERRRHEISVSLREISYRRSSDRDFLKRIIFVRRPINMRILLSGTKLGFFSNRITLKITISGQSLYFIDKIPLDD